ncbi:hypothetical protein JB92DRAFT_2995891 [Gautieria morchelliformis]|nr:hypothetical protein JB92DRAFT_2995891 [Gautieria morchelliformis]
MIAEGQTIQMVGRTCAWLRITTRGWRGPLRPPHRQQMLPVWRWWDAWQCSQTQYLPLQARTPGDQITRHSTQTSAVWPVDAARHVAQMYP